MDQAVAVIPAIVHSAHSKVACHVTYQQAPPCQARHPTSADLPAETAPTECATVDKPRPLIAQLATNRDRPVCLPASSKSSALRGGTRRPGLSTPRCSGSSCLPQRLPRLRQGGSVVPPHWNCSCLALIVMSKCDKNDIRSNPLAPFRPSFSTTIKGTVLADTHPDGSRSP